MDILEHVPVGSKTTMRIGGTARYFTEPKTKEEVEQAYAFAREKGLPLIVLGSGANTVFCDDEVRALVVRLKYDAVIEENGALRVGGGKNLAMLINELAEQGKDLSPLTGIPGTVGGSIFGNAGQGPKGVWFDTFIESVTAFIDGDWATFSTDECAFAYRESIFKTMARQGSTVIIWEAALSLLPADPSVIKEKIQALLQTRIETQPHRKTAGSCFKAVGGTPAWQLIDKAGLRGFTIGGVEIAQKHANFLLNTGEATYADAKAIVEKVKEAVGQDLEVEMRFIEPDGKTAF